METITLVTGNAHKLEQWQRIFPSDIPLTNTDIDLDEIQSFDPKVITEDKVKRAYAQLQKPVIVEDVSAGIDHLNGLPGPFIKFCEQQLGRSALYILAGNKESPATVTCTAAYYDGKNLLFGEGMVHGSVVPARGTEGFGFDYVFIPKGQLQTYAEMSHAQKDAISHRNLAIQDLLLQLRSLREYRAK
jgi:inosine triphosphate pyrophosphatase